MQGRESASSESMGIRRLDVEDCLGAAPNPVLRDTKGRVLVAERLRGPYVETDEGRRYIDWIMGHGSALLGHACPAVVEAVQTQAVGGFLPPTPSALELEVAERLRNALPSAESVVFAKNGSDVCTAAVRLARLVTGREGVLHFGYHGFHDWASAVNPNASGLPTSLRSLIATIPFGDLEALAALLQAHSHEVAALILEPFREQLPPPEYLRDAARLAREHGVVFILDELVTGFRLGIEGAQGRYAVRPDLSCYGKALSNGMPLAALAGRGDLLARIPEVGFGMTGRAERLSFAAAKACLEEYERLANEGEPASIRVAKIGERVRERFAAIADRLGIAAALIGDPAMLSFELPQEIEASFLEACVDRGLLTTGHLLPSTEHEEVLEASLAIFEQALEVARDSN